MIKDILSLALIYYLLKRTLLNCYFNEFLAGLPRDGEVFYLKTCGWFEIYLICLLAILEETNEADKEEGDSSVDIFYKVSTLRECKKRELK